MRHQKGKRPVKDDELTNSEKGKFFIQRAERYRSMRTAPASHSSFLVKLKVRYYGIFTSRYRKENISITRACLCDEGLLHRQKAFEDGTKRWEQNPLWPEILNIFRSVQIHDCPHC